MNLLADISLPQIAGILFAIISILVIGTIALYRQ
jgi:hypothetical protein